MRCRHIHHPGTLPPCGRPVCPGVRDLPHIYTGHMGASVLHRLVRAHNHPPLARQCVIPFTHPPAGPLVAYALLSPPSDLRLSHLLPLPCPSTRQHLAGSRRAGQTQSVMRLRLLHSFLAMQNFKPPRPSQHHISLSLAGLKGPWPLSCQRMPPAAKRRLFPQQSGSCWLQSAPTRACCSFLWGPVMAATCVCSE